MLHSRAMDQRAAVSQMGTDLRRNASDDSGMTLLELVIAASILLIAVMGLFSTLITSTSMSVQAKQQNIAVNTVNSFVEQVRAMPFDAVGIIGSTDPTGTIPATSTATVNGFTVSITPLVTWVYPDLAVPALRYKRLEVHVTVSAASTRSFSRTFVTYIRRPDALQSGLGGGDNPPSIVFVPGSKFLNAPPIYVSGTTELVSAFAKVADTSSATLKNVEFRCDGTLLYGLGGQDGVTAAWVNPGGTQGYFDFTWDTTAVDASGTVLFPDGQRILRILVWDTAGGYRYRDTPVLIDNGPPTLIVSPPVLVKRDSAYLSTLGWGPSSDGPDEWANHYVMHVWHETWSSTLGWHLEDFGDTENQSATLGSNPTTNTGQVASQPLNRFWIRVEPHSYRHLSPGLTDMVVPFISRPALSATPTVSATGNGANTIYTVSTAMAWQKPNFGWSSLSWVLERSWSPTFATVNWSATYTGSGTVSTTDVYVSPKQKDPPPPLYYRLRCDVVPSGPKADASLMRVYSNIVKVAATSVSAATVTSDWTANTAP